MNYPTRFFLILGPALMSLTATSLADSLISQHMNLYIAANAPPGAKTPVCAPQTVQSKPTWWVPDQNGEWQPLVWPMPAFKTIVPEDYNIPTALIATCDLRGQTGTTVYLGYGTSADEMLSVWRVREVYRVP